MIRSCSLFRVFVFPPIDFVQELRGIRIPVRIGGRPLQASASNGFSFLNSTDASASGFIGEQVQSSKVAAAAIK